MKKKKRGIDDELDVLEDEADEDGDELDPKKAKKKKREESAEKRRKAKKKDKAARWSGIILLIIMLIAGFLLWVSGEINSDRGQQDLRYTTPMSTPSGKVIIR